MSDKISFKVDFGEAATYTPYEGLGTSSLLKQDGFYAVTITKVVAGRSKESQNPKFTIALSVIDEDEKGATLLADVLAGGKDKNGNPLSRQLWDVFHSMGMTQAQVQGLAANGQQDGDVVISTLTGKTVYANVEAETYNGNTSSRVRGFIAGQRYNDAKAANAHRKPRKADVAFSGAPAGIQTPSTTTTAPAGLSLNGTGKVADPLARLSGLNLPV